LLSFRTEKISAFSALVICLATATACRSPSTAKGTFSMHGDVPATKVIMGCKEAVCAPARFSGDSTSLVSAPLE